MYKRQEGVYCIYFVTGINKPPNTKNPAASFMYTEVQITQFIYGEIERSVTIKLKFINYTVVKIGTILQHAWCSN